MNKSSRLITLWRIMVAGTRNFFRNAWLSIAATAVMVVTLTVMLSAIILNVALNDTLKQVTNKIDISIFFTDNTTPEQIAKVQEELKKTANVQSSRYVSKIEALSRYREQNKNNPELLEAVNEKENPLPQSIEIQVKDLKNTDAITALTQREEFKPLIQDTTHGEDRQKTIQRIGNINSFLTKVGLFGSLVFAIIAVLIIFNTIRMAIFSRGDELQIMRLIGATNGFIRGPFLFEAMLDGIVAAVITLITIYFLLFYGGPKLLSYVDFSHTLLLFGTHWTLVGLATMLAGMAIGALSAALAMIRYLKL